MRRLFGLCSVLMLLAACGSQPTASAPSGSNSATTTAITTIGETAATAPATTEATAAMTVTAPAVEEATSSAAARGELNVFAAASLTDAFEEIGKSFEAANPGATITFNFAGSQQLAQQIAQGAPVDVFASANRTQMNNVIASGQVISGTEQVFVRNRLVVIAPKDNRAGVQSLADLAKPGVKLVLADKAVPVGQYSLDFLAKASQLPEYTETYSPTVLSNVVSYEENVRAVLQKVALGEGDAGIVYTSDITGSAADQIARIDIPDNLNTIASYPVASTTTSQNPQLAEQFVQYLLSSEAQEVLAKYGFIPVDEATSSS